MSISMDDLFLFVNLVLHIVFIILKTIFHQFRVESKYICQIDRYMKGYQLTLDFVYGVLVQLY